MTTEPKQLMKFDDDAVANLSAIEVAHFIAAANSLAKDPVGYVQLVSQTIAKCAVSCPKEWGEPNDPTTYERLPWKTNFQAVTRELSNELNSNAKN